MALSVGEVNLDIRVREQHARIFRRGGILSGCCKVQRGAPKPVASIDVER